MRRDAAPYQFSVNAGPDSRRKKMRVRVAQKGGGSEQRAHTLHSATPSLIFSFIVAPALTQRFTFTGKRVRQGGAEKGWRPVGVGSG
ncbi:hypothetical protein CRX72_27075 [Pantoea sp. BRM17]|nr:hypothetical protein CRX72_27075 [Pantoea sp. BRM17]